VGDVPLKIEPAVGVGFDRLRIAHDGLPKTTFLGEQLFGATRIGYAVELLKVVFGAVKCAVGGLQTRGPFRRNGCAFE